MFVMVEVCLDSLVPTYLSEGLEMNWTNRVLFELLAKSKSCVGVT